jgi:hypothetical protein
MANENQLGLPVVDIDRIVHRYSSCDTPFWVFVEMVPPNTCHLALTGRGRS